MERLLLTIGRKTCPYSCVYCFTDFSQYERPLSIDAVERDPRLLQEVAIVYPACDVDLFALKRWPELLDRAAALGPSISLSTKADLDHGSVAKIREVAEVMASRGKLLKIGVSISTSSRGRELEPHAPPYSRRLATLERLAGANIDSALVARPLLVDIAPAEYEAIVEDASPFVQHILTGPEHLDDDLSHSRRSPRAPHPQPERRSINWAIGVPRWQSRNAPAQEKAVRRAAARHGLSVFNSDLNLMAELMRRASRRCAAAG